MGLILFLLFLTIPLIEIGLFIQVGGLIGLWPTIGIVILTAVLGAALWRQQGLAVMARAQEALNRGELPVTEVMDGAFLLVAGALLLTPGFATDTFGFLLFVPAFRQFLGRMVFNHMRKSGNVHIHTSGGSTGAPYGNGPQGRGPTGRGIIDGEAKDLDDERN